MPTTKSDINITPLIDIVLVLLIVFIVLVPSLSKALAVAVPRTEIVAKGEARPEALVVTLDPDGKVYLQREEMAPGGLCSVLASVVLLQPLGERKVFLKVDGDVPHQRAVGVLDQIRLASLQARRETAGRPGYGLEDGGEIKVVVSLLKRS